MQQRLEHPRHHVVDANTGGRSFLLPQAV
jgi:hypothetical protein